ncbi:Mdm32p NDAI_0C01270 [Naumovozyma dairenensis CBS 421]|uniref:Mitochondrial distribution and morphology protein 32 n=1 Tax=Naumovozyma dairenensis (strain ATCC 10597 / BCRC 20456 / CBS 421 / NBRC 0211 / NRRL Y-12639) TaxID=1071378 RepID=G0W7M7_NAUDC|nr:hypothetical protein NDAI_0C01270 [Naumovozyma dairenensis CBS 421]CCD23788.1 hypothetical protein NDAI_0C01270 [Naumovozyma dairenensis CBS 421]
MQGILHVLSRNAYPQILIKPAILLPTLFLATKRRTYSSILRRKHDIKSHSLPSAFSTALRSVRPIPSIRSIHNYSPIFQENLRDKKPISPQGLIDNKSQSSISKKMTSNNIKQTTAEGYLPTSSTKRKTSSMVSRLCWLIFGSITLFITLPYAMDTDTVKSLINKTIHNAVFIQLRHLNNKINSSPHSADHKLRINLKFNKASICDWKQNLIKFDDVMITVAQEHGNDLNCKIYQVTISLSIKKWFNGNGLVNDVSIFGLESDLTSIDNSFDDNNNGLIEQFIQCSNYEFGTVKINDSFLKLNEKKFSIFNLELNKLRLSKLLLDFLNATVITGSINNSLFSLHKRQHKLTNLNDVRKDLSPSFQKITRIRLNTINVNDLGLSKTKSYNWIKDGNVEIILDMMLPQNDDHTITTSTRNQNKYMIMDLKFKFKDLKAHLPARPPSLPTTNEPIISLEELKPVIGYINLQRILVNTMKSHEPNIDTSSTYITLNSPMWNSPNVSIQRKKSMLMNNNNSNKNNNHTNTSEKNNSTIIKNNDNKGITINNDNEIILNCKIVKNMVDFENKISFKQTGIYDQLTLELYDDLTRIVEEWEYKNKNDWINQWGTTFASQLLLFGFGAIV